MSDKKTNKRKLRIIFFIILVIIAFLLFSLYYGHRLTVKNYVIETNKLTESIRIVLIADLHSNLYGKNQSRLIGTVIAQNPDIILFAGDIADDRIKITGTVDLLEGIADKYPCFYVTGNHEFWSGEVDAVKELFRSYGVRVLEGENEAVTVNGQTIIICGIDDPGTRWGYTDEETFNRQLEQAFEGLDGESYTILLTHRPDRIAGYVPYSPDLVLSGHSHGGQWRIPLILNGLYSPNQGIFPKYAGGIYEYNGVFMVVSRGLAKYSTPVPRIFNPPELVVIDIIGINEK